jgi:putative membrane protein
VFGRFAQQIGIGFTDWIARYLVLTNRIQIRTEGLDHLPDGPVVIAARHYHNLYDGVALVRCIPRPVRILVALDWVASHRGRTFMEGITGLARWPVVLRAEMLTPGPDGRKPHARSAFALEEVEPYYERAKRRAVELLSEGEAVVVFPEAYPNVDPHITLKQDLEEFLPFRAGFARIAELASENLGRRVPIVPVGFAYAGPPWTSIVMRFGPPLPDPDPRDRRALIRAAQEAVEKLSAPV